jgi:hypothetical protein
MSKRIEIEKLSEEEKAKLPLYNEKWLRQTYDYSPLDEDKIKEIVAKIYKANDMEVPPIYFASSPVKAIDKARELGAEADASSFSWCQHDSNAIGFFDFLINEYHDREIAAEIEKEVGYMIEAAQHMGWTLFFDEACIVTKKPKITLEEDVFAENPPTSVTLHNLEGAAVFYEKDDPNNIYCVRGVEVPKYVIENPEQITVEDIESERNIEIKRVKIDKYGQTRYLQDSKAEIIHEDDFGVLYRKRIPGDEDLMMVKVVNSTPEPDGTYKDYFLRVDPSSYGGLKTARDAVASTWRNKDGSLYFDDPNDYSDNLVAES